MLRFLGVIAVLHLLAQAAGVRVQAADDDGCESPCSDCQGGNCAASSEDSEHRPTCADCLCCAHKTPPLLATFRASTLMDGVAISFLTPALPRLSADPHEILHVPRTRASS